MAVQKVNLEARLIYKIPNKDTCILQVYIEKPKFRKKTLLHYSYKFGKFFKTGRLTERQT
jgi:hypothetical protein